MLSSKTPVSGVARRISVSTASDHGRSLTFTKGVCRYLLLNLVARTSPRNRLTVSNQQRAVKRHHSGKYSGGVQVQVRDAFGFVNRKNVNQDMEVVFGSLLLNGQYRCVPTVEISDCDCVFRYEFELYVVRTARHSEDAAVFRRQLVCLNHYLRPFSCASHCN